jgi:hypothetical protein
VALRAEREERQVAGPAGRPRQSRRRKRASLYQPVVLRIANKVAAAVLLSVSLLG